MSYLFIKDFFVKLEALIFFRSFRNYIWLTTSYCLDNVNLSPGGDGWRLNSAFNVQSIPLMQLGGGNAAIAYVILELHLTIGILTRAR